eukprot:Phypoly_transcript_23005.p1 GENE.Phypoly_transcript_23005~~Phypoly_transcript_23005.p1  ORF type:complete len:104 (+),score=13.13 Phypoly_transcript_23005:147-458(+)
MYPIYSTNSYSVSQSNAVSPHPPSATGAGLTFSKNGNFYLAIGFAGGSQREIEVWKYNRDSGWQFMAGQTGQPDANFYATVWATQTSLRIFGGQFTNSTSTCT